MTDTLFFDTDCISAFLWVRNESLIIKMYPGRVVIPKPVYDALSQPGISHLKARLDTLIHNNQVRIEDILTGTDAYSLYYQLTILPANGHAIRKQNLGTDVSKKAETRCSFLYGLLV